MGRVTRPQPKRLAEKLLQIRTRLELSQNEIIRRMGLEQELRREEISDFERGRRVPSLLVTLCYARSFGISADVLIDDELELPQKAKYRRKRKSPRV